ncbi:MULTISPECIES: DUF4233 domain-containing protein [Corynebacterium]|uniref:DUF4233 domain-containing protein n=1 Tax=Corynebacterium aurimucosum TaxID=169292 RepID=A0A558GHZ1_9CORY|nr:MULTISPECIES: DUF4233 domain-containing protein [Corynebacterium]MBU5654375.1 DUF4233 domain-containing protein [Corynebacterium aurimucosum]MDK6814280.1 DUF4233 domain-containing protein [Corynebacterium sp. UMB6689]OFL23839.1 hypothetical protein HMPREF2781_08390 [Corynebacterium sp. HMSC062A03]OFP19599.1 hypothetical protein HMPREF2996_07765 [Corynebacterium sp. HMSC066C02]OFQ32813.1 hypothetical protein HMPREF2943_06375 [Corynebacterium sp. HMSC072D12]
MSPRKPVPEEEIGPLGLGQAPAKDPLKQFGGMVVASSLTMELITLVLALPMLYKLYDGTLWTPFNYGVVIGFMVLLLASFPFMNKPWIVGVQIVLHVIGIVLGFMVHWSVATIFIIFALLWALAAYMRSVIVARMERGYLTTQHLTEK